MKIKNILPIILIGVLVMANFAFASDSPHAKAYEILKRLNDWDKTEIDAYEKGEYYLKEKNYVASGETGSWISSNKDELHKLGYMVVWNGEKLIYELFFSIGAVDPKQADRLTILLNKNNIGNIIEGSIAYSIWVIPEKSEEAIKLLREDSEKENYWIQLNDGITNQSTGPDSAPDGAPSVR